jgi:hypothetical protein
LLQKGRIVEIDNHQGLSTGEIQKANSISKKRGAPDAGGKWQEQPPQNSFMTIRSSIVAVMVTGQRSHMVCRKLKIGQYTWYHYDRKSNESKKR